MIDRLRSIRIRLLAVVSAVILAPLLFVALSSWYDAGVTHRLGENARKAAEAAIAASDPNAIERIAHERKVWIRVFAAGSNRADADTNRLSEPELFKPLARRVYRGVEKVSSVVTFDRSLGPLGRRAEVVEAVAQGHSADCRTIAEGIHIICHAVIRAGDRVAYAIDTQRTPVGAFHDQSFQLARLTAIVMPLGLLLALWLGSRIMKPIRDLRAQALEAARTQSGRVELEISQRDEFGDLVDAFNTLLAALEDRRRSNEAFVTDLAHEFKNPIAALRAAAEKLSDQDGANRDRLDRLSRVISDSSQQLDRMVSMFLELARAESGWKNEPRVPVSLAALIEEVQGQASRDARYAHLKFELAAADNVVVPGVPFAIEVIVRNLVENAASFAGAAGLVRTSLSREGTAAQITVQDNGPGISPEDLPFVFERFFTKRKSGVGTGLGLAMVKAAAESHGGSVTARSTPGEGTLFAVRLPVTS